MICPRCYGNGQLYVPVGRPTEGGIMPEQCPDCMGTGILHCCEGLQEQPEPRGILDQLYDWYRDLGGEGGGA